MKHSLLILTVLTVLFSCTRNNDDTRNDTRDAGTGTATDTGTTTTPGPNP